MIIPLKKKMAIYFSWIMIVPYGLYQLMVIFPPKLIDIPLLVVLCISAIVVSAFPFVVSGRPLLLLQWVCITVFLKFGLFAEVLLYQVILIPLFIRLKVKKEYDRYILNSLLFFLSSVFAGIVYILLGGKFGTLDVWHVLIYTFIYQVCFLFANHFLLNMMNRFLNRRHLFFSRVFFLDSLMILITFPFGVILYLLTESIGAIAVVLLMIPFIVFSVILKRYDATGKVNKSLKVAVRFGRELSENKSRHTLLDLFMDRLPQLIDIDHVFLADCVGETEMVRMIRVSQNADEQMEAKIQEKFGYLCANRVMKRKKALLFNVRKEWDSSFAEVLPENLETLFIQPVILNNKMEGVVILTSQKRQAFRSYEIGLVDLLCSYLAVSLDKISYMENVIRQSESCGLTGLHNYRYFDDQLAIHSKMLEKGTISEISLIMLDIDYFKKINDTYGHESGNDILKEFAQQLRNIVPEGAILARYGGEEFVILLPNTSKAESLKIAEQIRLSIEEHPFDIVADLEDQRSEIMVYITSSIGVSAVPEDCEDVMELTRNADRALYVGAKQQGRNRVASYVK